MLHLILNKQTPHYVLNTTDRRLKLHICFRLSEAKQKLSDINIGIMSDSHLLPLHDDRLRQRVVAALLVGEALQIIQLCLQLENEILLFFPLSLQTLPLLPLSLTENNTQ